MTDALPPALPLSAEAVRGRLVDALRRDLVGPGPEDADLAREILTENPSRWYLTGFLAPSPEGGGAVEESDGLDEEGDPLFGDDAGADPETGPARAADDAPPDEPSARPRRLPASLGLTALVPEGVAEVGVALTWGDYATEPPLPPEVLADTQAQFDPKYRDVRWRRVPGEAVVRVPVPDGRGARVPLPGTGGAQRPAGGLSIEAHARPYAIEQPDGRVARVRALTVMVVNRRPPPARRRFADVTFAFQARLELRCASGFHPRRDLSGYGSADPDAALADLHFRGVAEFAVGRGASAGWRRDPDGTVRTVFTDHLPRAEVERVEPNEGLAGVEFGMEALAALARGGAGGLGDALVGLPAAYRAWIAAQAAGVPEIPGPARQATAERLLGAAREAGARIADGIALLRADGRARRAFEAMNEAVARAARRRNAGPGGDPAAQPAPRWRPFQLAFVLLNLRGLAEPSHRDREVADLLFFPTGGGKTEAYLGLAAWMIAHRRLSNGGPLGAGVTVLMRYTLRLLTLDQLSRAAGVEGARRRGRQAPPRLAGALRVRLREGAPAGHRVAAHPPRRRLGLPRADVARGLRHKRRPARHARRLRLRPVAHPGGAVPAGPARAVPGRAALDRRLRPRAVRRAEGSEPAHAERHQHLLPAGRDGDLAAAVGGRAVAPDRAALVRPAEGQER